MNLIDTHCHLYLADFEKDISELMMRAKSAGVQKFYLPSIDSSVIADMITLEHAYPGECIAMMGLHPCSVKENFDQELEIAEDWLHKRKFAAIGEIGLDFYWDKTFASQQYQAFELQMKWALQQNMPVVIHTRNAMQETISSVKPFAAKGLRGIFHCFSGTADDAVAITEMGFLLGIGGVLTYKNAGLQQVIANVDIHSIVLETDAPYLTPVPFRGKRNESSYLTYIAEKLSEIKQVSVAEIAAITTANAEKIFAN